MPRVLVTNDDGIDADGISSLVAALVGAGYEPLVVAPNADYSGAGSSVLSISSDSGLSGQIAYERRVLDVAPEVEAYAIDGPPARCVLLALREAFGPKPDMVASGINFGLNTGLAVAHSGTVSAALTARSFDIPALAVSAEFDFENETPPLYDTAAELAVQVLGELPASSHDVLSLNVPRLELADVKGVVHAPLATVSTYRSYVESRTDTTLTLAYERNGAGADTQSDVAQVAAGFATLTSLVGATASSVSCVDLAAKLSESRT